MKKKTKRLIKDLNIRIASLECEANERQTKTYFDNIFEVKLDPWGRMPTKAHDTDAGYDLYCPYDIDIARNGEIKYSSADHLEAKTVDDTNRVIQIETGVHILIPAHYEGSIRPRSSFSSYGINCAYGTVDAGYTGEIKICYQMSDLERYVGGLRRNDFKAWEDLPIRVFHKGERVAQIVFSPILSPVLSWVDVFSLAFERGNNGFGSTGE